MISIILRLTFTLFVFMTLPQLTSDPATAQSDIERAAYDRFGPITEGHTPGFAVGVVQDGELIHHSYWGLANLETGTPVNADSRFYIASVSKQFTAALTAILIEEDKLTLNDSVREHLPWLPALYEPVTIADCLWHTGGIREYTSLLLIRGDDLRGQDKMSQSDALALIASQEELDFIPGTEQRYSSSGYVLLAAIIEKIEGRSLRDTAKTRLFTPLKMHDTLFDDDHGEPIQHRVTSYRHQEPSRRGTWRQWLKHFDVVGDGGVLTTIQDLARWDNEMATGAVLGRNVLSTIKQPGHLRDGTPIHYGGGLWFAADRKIEHHGGGMGGFITDQIRYPDLGLSIYVMANRNDKHAFQAWMFAAELLDILGLSPPAPAAESPEPAAPLPGDGDKWIGAYFMHSRNNRRFVKNYDGGGIALFGGGGEFLTRLIPTAEDGLYRTHPSNNTVRFSKTNMGPVLQVATPTYSYEAISYDDTPPVSIEQIAEFEGQFCSPELDAAITFTVSAGALVFKHAHQEPIELWPSPSRPNISWNGVDRVWTGAFMIKARRSPDGDVTSLGLGDGRVSNVLFERC